MIHHISLKKKTNIGHAQGINKDEHYITLNEQCIEFLTTLD